MESRIFSDFEKKIIKNAYGKVNLYSQKNIFFIQRHEGNRPPHAINYKGYIQALSDLGIGKIISINSVGSLKESILPGSVLLPHDFIGLWEVPTFFDKEICHVSPSFDEKMRGDIGKIAKKLKIKIRKFGVYFQATGPRFETPSEILLMSNFADVVGMTLASEATLAAEKGMKIASICTVDNFANGIKKEKVSYRKIRAGARKNKKSLERILKEVIKLYS